MLSWPLRAALRLLCVAALACPCARALADAERAADGVPAKSAEPAEADSPEYRQAVEDAVREFAAGRFAEARALFRYAHELSPNARTLRGLGMTAFELRAYAHAIRDLTASLNDARKPLDTGMRAQVNELIAKARHFVGELRVELAPAHAQLLVDGTAPEREPDGSLVLDAGTHVLSATAEGYKPTNVRSLVEGGSSQAVLLTLEPILAPQPTIASLPAQAEPAPVAPRQPAPAVARQPVLGPEAAATESDAESESSVGGWAVGTLVGAATFGAGAAVTWLLADGEYDELQSTCAPNCSNAQIDDSGVETLDTITTVLVGLAVASGTASLVLFTIDAADGEEDSAAQPAALELRVAPGSALVRGAF